MARSLQRLERLGAGGDNGDVDVVVAQQFVNAELLGGIVFDDQQPLAARRGVFLDARQAPLRVLRAWSAW